MKRQLRLSDTRAEAEEVLLELLRRKTPAEKLCQVNQLNDTVRTLALSGLRERLGEIDEVQIHRHLADLLLGAELAEKVYGQMPQSL